MNGGSPIRISSSLNPSAATATLVLQSLTAADDADYRGIVCNSVGCATSAWARVSLRIPPAITTHPQPRTVMPGGSVTFNVTATGTAPLSYRWEHQDLNGNISTVLGATSPSLTLNTVSYLIHAGSYRVWVMNAANPAGLASNWAKLTIGPAILGLVPASPSVNEGDPVSFTASANGTAPLVFNWFHDGTLRQSGLTLNIPSTREADDGAWRLDVTNLAGKVSQTFTLTVIPPPTPPSFLLSPANAALTDRKSVV